MCPLTFLKNFASRGIVLRKKAKGKREHVDYINLYVDYEKRKN